MINAFKTAALLAALSAILMIIGQMVGGQNGLVIAFGIAIAMNFGSYWFSDRIVLRMYRAREVGPDHPLHALTAELAGRADLPMPRVYVIPTASPNAFATGRNPRHAAVAATEGILATLNRDELAGVIAHELAHIQNRDILTASIAATVAAAITYLAYFAMWFGGSRDRNVHPAVQILMLILAPVAAAIIQAAISRSREFAADEAGARIAGRPDGLASALRKIEVAARRTPLPSGPAAQATEHMFIVKPFSGKGALRLFSTHPPTDDRIARLMGVRT
jgi:heat shock protein HtpX